MLFAVFFGAGNLIFPLSLGQASGTNLFEAITGFLLTGVGLPLLGVVAIGVSKNEDIQAISSRVHPAFGLLFPIIIYLTIGPLFAVPRTGTVSYEIGISPFLSEGLRNSAWGMILYSIVFFSVTYWLALNPGKVVDRIGKILTPVLLFILLGLLVMTITNPIGTIQTPLAAYEGAPFFKGFQEGYLTMDTICAVVFGLIIIESIRAKGVENTATIAKICTYAGLIAAAGLAIVYVGLSYAGATSVDALGYLDNGGKILTGVTQLQFGTYGSLVLGIAVLFACLTTSVGLIVACSAYFNRIRPSISYKSYVLILTVVSMLISNVGLTQIISFSVPVLVAIYPIVIVLIGLTLLGAVFGKRNSVYTFAVLFTAIVSLVEGISAGGIETSINNLFADYLPLYSLGLGWLLPAIAGSFLGYLLSLRNTTVAVANE